MCTRYISPEAGDIERLWHVGGRNPPRWAHDVFPRYGIPAEMFFEPCWETGKHIPWRFRRADGELWGLAGLWNTWTDKETGEVVESFTMLTINADGHPLMGRMHRPDPKRPPNMQDKRSVVPIELPDVDAWLSAPLEEAAKLVRLAPAAVFDAKTAVDAPAG